MKRPKKNINKNSKPLNEKNKQKSQAIGYIQTPQIYLLWLSMRPQVGQWHRCLEGCV